MVGILIDTETGDLRVENGALVIGDNTEQVTELVIMAARGELKELPLIGAEITRMKNGNYDPLWAANARRMLEACGIPIKRVVQKDNIITIE